MAEGKVEANGIELWYEDFGDGAAPTVLLVWGAGEQCTGWPMDLIEFLVEAGFHVVRFDNRDVGYSTWIEDYESDPYTTEDMAADAVGLMDALGIEQAHLIGVSMGGMIAQHMAIDYPTRVASMTSWMSTYWHSDPDVPAMDPEVEERLGEYMEAPALEREQMLDTFVEMDRLLSGSRFPFDERSVRAKRSMELDRGFNPNQHHYAADLPVASRLDSLRELEVSTLIIHGDEDPIINYCHGVVCAKVIPGAKLLTQKGVGHEIPAEIIPETSEAIVNHIRGSSH